MLTYLFLIYIIWQQMNINTTLDSPSVLDGDNDGDLNNVVLGELFHYTFHIPNSFFWDITHISYYLPT